MTTVTDPEQELQRLYRARRTPEFVEVPELSFLMIDGHGDPNHSQRYQQAVQALYAVSYALKFALKSSSTWTTGSPRWRACGGPRTWPSSASGARATGTGR